jgi:eukaryotic-like serine/threonine-protein kinase
MFVFHCHPDRGSAFGPTRDLSSIAALTQSAVGAQQNMPLIPGTQLGPYEIIGPLGVGGMGEVYRARDSKLGREVALKVLPAAFAADVERMARFRREAQVLASLNHPNIAAVYGLEDGSLPEDKPPAVHLDPNSSSRAPVIVSGTPPALVMELVEGPTLAERLRQRRLELEDSLPIARQIAEALEAAHDRGIIHRDLKPANVKIRPDGVVKILDFGLAKAVQGDPASSDLQNSPTISHMTTMAGTILGTAAYMSPEQAKGKTLDRRTDVWSFGCVLFEMLSGKQAFSGETSSDILADVIRGEPHWQELPATLPARLSELLRRCLQKDSKQRLQAIGEARIAIEQTLAEITVVANSSIETMAAAAASASGVHPPNAASPSSGISAPSLAAIPVASRKGSILPWILAALFASLAAWMGYNQIAYSKNPAPAIVTQILPPDGETFALTGNYAGPPVLSPDSRYLAFVTANKDGLRRLWIRPLSDAKPQLIANSDGATEPFWSPDSRSVAYFASGKMYRVDISGGSSRLVTVATNSRGGAWSSNGTILYGPNPALGLWTVPESGGPGQALTKPDPIVHTPNRRWPQFLPDGKHFICFARSDVTAAESGVFAGSLDGSPLKLILHTDSSAIYAPPGYLLFIQGGVLVAQKFDLRSLSVSGEPLPLAQHAEVNAIVYRGIVAASDNGLLVYGTGSGAQGSYSIQWADRQGKVLQTIGDPAEYSDPRISHDGQKLAVSIDTGEGGNNIWVFDLAHGTRNRVTFGNGINAGATWSPDDKSLIFSSGRGGTFQLYEQPADGSGEARRITDSTATEVAGFWSRDGKYLAYTVPNSGNDASQIWLLPFFGARKPYAFLHSSYDVLNPAISPDSKWLAFASNETGHNEIYVVPLAGGAGKWQVSSQGGVEPRWSSTGNEISYLSPDGDLMVADIQSSSNSIGVGKVTKLFHVGETSALTIFRYDFPPDGKRFLVMTAGVQAHTDPLTVVSNWTALLPK